MPWAWAFHSALPRPISRTGHNMTTSLMPEPRQRYFNSNGQPLAGGLVYTYAAGTNTPKETFTDSAGTTPSTNPIVLDVNGEAIIYWSGAYKVNIFSSTGVQIVGYPVDNFVSFNVFSDLISLELDTFKNNLLSDTGSNLVGFLQTGSDAVYQKVQTKLENSIVFVEDFGKIGIGNDKSVVQAAVNACKNGRTLDFGGLSFDFGTVPSGSYAILIDSPVGMKVIASGAQFNCICTAGRSSIFRVKNAVDFSSDGLNGTQPGYDISSTGGSSNSANGVYLYHFYGAAPYSSANPCGNIKVNGIAHDCVGLVTVDCTTQMGISGAVPYSVRNVKVTGSCSRVYYAASSIYGAKDMEVDIACLDVRRGFISYGQDRAKVNLALECTAGFLGSNAFCELACEGSATGNVKDIDIRVKVSGVEAHTDIVNFYHQAAGGTAGSIANIKAYVTLDNLTTVGKNPSLTPLNVFSFLHENPATGGAFSSTIRETTNLDIDCEVLGSISGEIINLQTVPLTPYPISIGRGVTDGVTNFDMWVWFKVLRGAKTLPFTPFAAGKTSFGSATYSMQKGYITVIDGMVTCTGSLTWVSNTGTGSLYISTLPLKGLSSSLLGNPPAAILASDFGASGSTIGALLTGQMDELSIYSISSTTRVATLQSVPASGSIYFSCSYPIY